MTTGLIELSDHAPQTVAVVHGHVKNSEYDEFLAAAFAEVRRLLADQHLTPAGPAVVRYRPTGVGLDVDAGIPVDDRFRPSGRVTAELLPGGPVVTAPHVGDHGTVGFTYQLLQEWLAGNDYQPAGDPWETCPGDATGQTVVTVPCRPCPPNPRPYRIHP